jgi:N-acetylneuraminic acid mutarotase
MQNAALEGNQGGCEMRRSSVFSKLVVLSIFCIFMITVVPLCTIDKAISVAEVSTDESSPMTSPEEMMFARAQDDMPLRMDADLVYDSESDRMIFFGGATENLQTDWDDTWSYDYNTNNWTEMSPAISPPASDWHQMAYHSGQDKVVLFGGHVAGGGTDWQNHDETWTYDLNTDTWTNMAPASAPPALAAQTMAYDSESDLIVLFGGSGDDWYSNNHMYSDTWTYDLISNTWTNVTTSIHPSPRSWPVMAYDIESDLMVLFGGWEIVGGEWIVLNDTWTYDTNTNTWAEIVIPDGPDSLGDLVYDSESDRMVFFGGALSLSELVEDLVSETWSYDTNTETWEMMNVDIRPPPRSRVQMTYDSESDVAILFGGIIDGGWPTEEVVYDCWAYSLNGNYWNNVNWDWQQVTPDVSPEPREGCSMTYDSESDLVVMFGGSLNLTYVDGPVPDFWGDNETWTYNYTSNTWTNMTPANSPPMRYGAGMVYDEESDIIVMYGGIGSNGTHHQSLNDTWAYDANTNTWTNMSPAVAPSAWTDYSFNIREGQRMTYDSKSDLVILFGPSRETWTYNYNSNTWTMMIHSPEEAPSGMDSAVLVYDEESGVSVLYGRPWGTYMGPPAETWVYNYTSDTWTQMSPLYFPFQRYRASAVYDSSADRIIMFGGSTYTYEMLLNETWSYDYNSNTWFEMNTPSNPSARRLAGLAFDEVTNRTILFGGGDPGYYGDPWCSSETWVYRYMINPPLAPSNLEVVQNGADLVLTWDAPRANPDTPIIGYSVYRGTMSGTYTLLSEIGNITTYTDASVPKFAWFYYVVAAITEVGEGDYSNEASGIREPIHTPAADDEIATFIAYGDTRASDETAVAAVHKSLVFEYLKKDPEMIINTGDMVNHGGEAYQWPLFEASIAWVRDENIPYYAAAGNHEWYTDVYGVNDEDLSTYIDNFASTFSDVIDEPGETELYYSFDWENIHFIFLNTVFNWTGDVYTCTTAQWDWLEADLAANDLEFIIVSFHNPMYSVQKDRPDKWAQAESLRDTFQTLFEENGVDIVFNGHDHHYYRTVRNGIQYIVTGGGGAPLYDIQYQGTVWKAGDRGFVEHHYCVCRINNETSTLDVQVVTIDGFVADEFSLALDSTDPEIDHPADIEYEEGSTGHNIVWSPSDLYPDSFNLYKDGAIFDSGVWDGLSITASVDGLTVETYNFTLVVYDR